MINVDAEDTATIKNICDWYILNEPQKIAKVYPVKNLKFEHAKFVANFAP